jgi:competence protein ComEA
MDHETTDNPPVDQAGSDSVSQTGEQNSVPTPPKTVPEEPLQSSFWLTHSDQYFLGTLVIIMLALMGWRWVRVSQFGSEPVEIERLESEQLKYRIDINTATRIEWMQLGGIGETLADRILVYRETNGRFEAIEDLDRVKGIGPKTIARIRKYLTVKPARESKS